MADRKVSRRKFLLGAVGVMGVGLLACGGAAALTLPYPAKSFPIEGCGEATEDGKVLVAYASVCGSTAEVAEAVGRTLCEAGLAVDVLSVADVKDLSPYRAVVLGSAARMSNLLREARSFVARHAETLQSLPVAYFCVCGTMNVDTPENRATTGAYLAPLLAAKASVVDPGLFGGKIDAATLGPVYGLMVQQGGMEEGDYRDWAAIGAWAAALAPALA
ncbi:MAG: flavodoxin domain-containing protein [Anaerolineae bacterium]